MVSGIAAAMAGLDASQVSVASQMGANAAANNYLNHTEAARLSILQERQMAGQCDSACDKELKSLQTLDAARNQTLSDCTGVTSDACNQARQDVRDAAAGYIRQTNYSPDLTYQNEKNETISLAEDTIDGIDSAKIIGYLTSVKDGLLTLANAGYVGFNALILQDPQAQQEIQDSAGAAWTYISNPANWPQLLGGMSDSDREKLANAYETGDGTTIGQMLGAQYASLPTGGGMGTIEKIDSLITAAKDAEAAALKAEEAADAVAGAGNAGGAVVTSTTSGTTPMISGVTVVDKRTGFVYQGTVDLQPTLDRIADDGAPLSRNDGTIFQNHPINGVQLLPVEPIGYYTEYVVPTPGIEGPGPQRIVMGKSGEIYYTPDHYQSFISVKK